MVKALCYLDIEANLTQYPHNNFCSFFVRP